MVCISKSFMLGFTCRLIKDRKGRYWARAAVMPCFVQNLESSSKHEHFISDKGLALLTRTIDPPLSAGQCRRAHAACLPVFTRPQQKRMLVCPFSVPLSSRGTRPWSLWVPVWTSTWPFTPYSHDNLGCLTSIYGFTICV